jgi:D-3-phosphoglycerate dehydrogenase
MRYRIVQTDNGSFLPVLDRNAQKKLNCKLRIADIRSEEETLSVCQDAHVVLATRGQFTKKVLKKMKDCLAIIRFGVGVDNIDVTSATELGIVVAHVPDFCIDEVSDTVAGLILMLNRKICYMHQKVMAGHWDRRLARPVHRLENKTLGLLGFGKVARGVATKMNIFGLNIIIYDPYVKAKDIKKFSVSPASLDKLLRQSDFLSLHLPLTKETYHLIGKEQLYKMKRDSYLINTSRGKIINEIALYKALKKGWISGAALDVLEQEPPNYKNPLFKLDNVIITPHFASYSEESFKELENKVKKAAIAVLKGRFPNYIANTDVKSKARLLKNF